MPESSSLTPEEIIARREGKLQELRQAGKAYPNDFRRSHLIREARTLALGTEVSLAGRFDLRRKAGKATFANLTDGSESLAGEADNDIQLYANQDTLEVLHDLNGLDFGDIVGIRGVLFKTRKGELTVKLGGLQVLSKCLQPYTVKGSSAEDRLRKRRYLALAVQSDLRCMFRTRSQLVSWLRRYFDEAGYLEVETPMLHQVQGGAAAKPFKTKHAALDQELFLRIAPELYLKRLLVGGFDKVFEINRAFRNEGMSEQHNPEFTMLEFYAAYANYGDLMDLTERLFRQLTTDSDWDWRRLAGTRKSEFKPGLLDVNGRQVDFNNAFVRKTLDQSIQEQFGCTVAEVHDLAFLAGLLEGVEGSKAGQAAAAGDVGKMQLAVFEKLIEHTLVQPTFITDYPASVSPLSRRQDNQAEGKVELVERFELFIGGCEIANGFSELNDPDSQDAVFRDQVKQGQTGNEEAMQYDADYIKALRYGMPPAAGEGIGIDRLAMLLLGVPSIRDIILFPQQRPEVPTKD